MTEQAIQTKIVKFLQGIGAYVVKVVVGNRAGIPDLLVCYQGEFIGIEVKKPETLSRVTPLQKHNIALITKAGGKAFVASSVEDVKNFLNIKE